jgi:hypothetical protein
VAPKGYTKIASRTSYALASPKDYRIEFGRDSFAENRRQALPLSVFEVEEDAGTLIVRARDRDLSLDVIEFFSAAFNELVLEVFRVLQDNPHTPRTSIDRLIVTREAWRFRARDCDLAFGKDETDRYLETREWATSCGLPRFAFAKLPVEIKPIYVDFDSPIYANLFWRKLKQTVESDLEDDWITMTEMLPAPDQTWIFDAEGRKYTSEFRIVVLDRASPPARDESSAQETAA